jgi:hypothetical protein
MAQKRPSKRGAGGAGENNTQQTEAGAVPWHNRRLVFGLAVVAAALGGGGVGRLLRPKASHAVSKSVQRALEHHRNFEGKRGPWGLIEYSRLAISMPLEYASAEADVEPTRWWFAGRTRDEVASIFAQASLTPKQLGTLAQGGWQVSPEGVMVVPPRELVIDLAPAARAHIYKLLSADERNGPQHAPEVFYPQFVDERLESSGLSDKTITLVRSLLYPRKTWTLFSDANVVVAGLQSESERRRFNQMVHRRLTLMAQLIIDKSTDIDAMVAYWDFRGRSKGMRSLFESLSRVPGGGELDISHVLTGFARTRLYTFPGPSEDPKVWRRDCGWTALNFFNSTPDDSLSDPQTAGLVLQRDYERVSVPGFGDIAALVDENDDSVHLATYLADGLTFTKNGYHRTQPWMLMKLDDLVAHYSISRDRNLDVWYFRRKG